MWISFWSSCYTRFWCRPVENYGYLQSSTGVFSTNFQKWKKLKIQNCLMRRRLIFVLWFCTFLEVLKIVHNFPEFYLFLYFYFYHKFAVIWEFPKFFQNIELLFCCCCCCFIPYFFLLTCFGTFCKTNQTNNLLLAIQREVGTSSSGLFCCIGNI